MNKIYLDNNSTTQLDPKIVDIMFPFFIEKYGNSSSKTHSYGWEAESYVEIARTKVARLINGDSSNIIFTSGATESNNLAILGSICSTSTSHIITMSSEHRAVLDICEYLEKKGVSITYLNPNKNGIIDIEKIKRNIKNNTKLISIMHVNNEIGVIQPIDKIGELCKKNNILFHVDAAQSLGKININIKKMNIDYISLSSHKIYGPKGVGCLFIKNISNKINPLFWGGGQERGIRPGTLPVPNIIGFGEACDIALNQMGQESKKILNLRNILIDEIIKEIPDVIINGDIEKRISGNINLSFPSLRGQSIISNLPNIAISTGSACTSSSPKPSHVLQSIGLSKQLANSSIRICIGRFNTLEEIEIASTDIVNAVKFKSKL